jgi:hypothetical protein
LRDTESLERLGPDRKDAAVKAVTKDRFFKPSPREAKADGITRTVRLIIEGERASFESKTQRLRTARLAKEAAEREADATIAMPESASRTKSGRSRRSR